MTNPEPPTTLLRVMAAVMERIWIVIACAFIAGVAAAAYSLAVTPQFRAVARFAPEEGRMPQIGGNLATLATQLGAGAALGGSRSLQFYAEVVISRDQLLEVARDSFPDPAAEGRRPLIDILEIQGVTPRLREDNVIDYLGDHAVTTVNDRTGTIDLAVTLPDPALAAQVANRLFSLLERFNIETRRSSASERVRFAEGEVAGARADLTQAEGEMQAFLEANRAGLNTPRLSFRRDRLQRQIDNLQQLYGSLTQELQEARIAEALDTPTFTLVQRGRPPVDRESPRRVRMTLLGAFLGGAAAVALIALYTTSHSVRALDPAGYADLRRAMRRPFSRS